MFPAVPFQVRSAADSVATANTTTAAADPTASVLAASGVANVTTSATASANIAAATASNATATCQCPPVARLFLSFA